MEGGAVKLLHWSLSQHVVVAYASGNPEDLVGSTVDFFDKGTAEKDFTPF